MGFSCPGRGVSLHGCSSKAQPLLLTLDEGYLLMAAPPDLECGVAPLGPPAPAQALLLGCWVAPPSHRPWPGSWGCSFLPLPLALGLGAWGSPSHPSPLASGLGAWGISSGQLPLASGLGRGHLLPATTPDLGLSGVAYDLCLFPRQTIQYQSNPSLCPNQ